jgi:drug/metabolite transporter (DMT)-like permease
LKKSFPYLAGIGFATIFGFSFMFSKIALEYTTAFQLIGLRFLLAAIIFEILRRLKIIKIKIGVNDFKSLLPIAIFQPVIYFFGETFGIQNASSGVVGLFIGLIPVVVAILAYFALGEKLSRGQVFFMIVSISGIVLISMMLMLDKNNMDTNIFGLVCLIITVLAAGIYNILSRKASKYYDPVSITYVMMLFGAIVFNFIGAIDSIIYHYSYFAPLSSLDFWVALIYLGLFSSIGAFFLMNYTLSKIPASQSALFVNLTTVISVFASAFLLKETFAYYHIIGSILIVAGVWGTNKFKEKNQLIKESNKK